MHAALDNDIGICFRRFNGKAETVACIIADEAKNTGVI